ncbi:MAG: sensor histidine kinase [Arachnia sp.]
MPVYRTVVVVTIGTVLGVLVTVLELGLLVDAQVPDEKIFGWLTVTVVVGLGSVSALVPLQRHGSFAAAVVVAIGSGCSGMAIPASMYAVFIVATRRRWPWILTVAMVGPAAGAFAMVVSNQWFNASESVLLEVLIRLAAASLAVLVALPTRDRLMKLDVLGREVAAARREQELTQREARARVLEAEDAERRRIAREVHDALSHELSVLALHAGALESRRELSPEDQQASLATIAETSRRAGDELRRVLTTLRDPELAAPPGIDQLPQLVAELRAQGTEVHCVCGDDLAELPSSVSQQLWRVAKELVNNARRHCPGEAVSVSLMGNPTSGITLGCTNPVGPSPNSSGSGMGLVGVRELARQLGGTLEARVSEGWFIARLWVPWPG